jgi:quercetin dioxygenase-like cupin family protein
MQGQQSETLKAYKRSPELSNSTWYKGILTSHMAGSLDTEGAFDFVISKMRAGTEPPPHVHSCEHEFMYLLSGMMRFYVEDQVLAVMAGECMFLPRGVPHGLLIESKEIDIITLVSPGGFFDAVNKMSMPAKRMGLPADAETLTYTTADLTETIKLLEKHGVQVLTPDEIRSHMPQYPR